MSADRDYVIDRIEAIDMHDISNPGGQFSAIPTGIRVHAFNRGGDAWFEWPANAGDPRIGQVVSVGLAPAPSQKGRSR